MDAQAILASDHRLSDAEAGRVEQTRKTLASYGDAGWEAEPVTVGVVAANLLAAFTALPFVLAEAAASVAVSGEALPAMDARGFAAFVASAVVLTVLHELCHGAFWAMSARSGSASISFGFILKTLTPYCHCSEPLGTRGYAAGLLAPLILTGLLPAAIGICMGSPALLVAGYAMTFGAGGDLLIAVLMVSRIARLHGSEAEWLDHPSKIGAIMLRRRRWRG